MHYQLNDKFVIYFYGNDIYLYDTKNYYGYTRLNEVEGDILLWINKLHDIDQAWIELKKEYHAEAEKASAREARRGTVEEKIAGLCVRYGMKAEFRSGSVYVTTYAGEWHFAYNDRPVTLYHSNAIPVKDKHGRIRRHSHIQPVELYSPLRAIHYIRNHEAAEEKRLMEKNNGKTE
jgi:hypothetical protein